MIPCMVAINVKGIANVNLSRAGRCPYVHQVRSGGTVRTKWCFILSPESTWFCIY